jgi:hypothetical protein
LFAKGQGVVSISNADIGFAISVDRVVFGAGIATTDLVASRTLKDLVLKIAGTADQLTIQNYFVRTDGFYKIDELRFADALADASETLTRDTGRRRWQRRAPGLRHR